MRTFAIALFLSVSVASTAYADQCAWVEPEIAEAGAKELLKAKIYVEYCAPCGSKRKPEKPSAPKKAGVVTTRAAGNDGLRKVVANGTALDLAYVYVKDGTQYTNLAKLAGCPTSDVPDAITLPVVDVKPMKP